MAELKLRGSYSVGDLASRRWPSGYLQFPLTTLWTLAYVRGDEMTAMKVRIVSSALANGTGQLVCGITRVRLEKWARRYLDGDV